MPEHDDLLASLMHQLAAGGLLQGGERVVVACSGGPDSLALLHLLWRASTTLRLSLVVAHFDHGLRRESAAEAAFVQSFAAGLGLPCSVARRPVARTPGRGRNLQAAARQARYAFLAETALAWQADAVAVAHQADDQAETVLLHLLRGAGPAGLRGMLPRVAWSAWAPGQGATGPALIRPLLDTPRAAIERYCAAQNFEPRRDPSNTAPRYTRARLRHTVLPALASIAPGAVAALGRTARICADDYACLQQHLDQVWPALTGQPGAASGQVSFTRAIWEALHPALQRYALRRAYALLAPMTEPDFATIEALRAAATTGDRRIFPGQLHIVPGAHGWALVSSAAPTEPWAGPQLLAPGRLRMPGHTLLDKGWSIEAWLGPAGEAPHAGPVRGTIAALQQAPATPWALLDADALGPVPWLRTRLPGDRMRPLGGRGSRRLQDLFVDLHVPRALRDHWPLLVGPGGIAWLAGLRIDAGAAATPATGTILAVRLIQAQR